jgi:hypothetical protein
MKQSDDENTVTLSDKRTFNAFSLNGPLANCHYCDFIYFSAKFCQKVKCMEDKRKDKTYVYFKEVKNEQNYKNN